MEDAMTQLMQQIMFLEMERDIPKDIDSNLLYIIFTHFMLHYNCFSFCLPNYFLWKIKATD